MNFCKSVTVSWARVFVYESLCDNLPTLPYYRRPHNTRRQNASVKHADGAACQTPRATRDCHTGGLGVVFFSARRGDGVGDEALFCLWKLVACANIQLFVSAFRVSCCLLVVLKPV